MNSPELSVVISSVNGMPAIGECLENLKRQSMAGRVEVIVANRCKNGVGKHIKEKYPWVRLIEASSEKSIPELRAMAFRESTGNIVAVLEDHCTVEEDWIKRMLEAHHGDYPVVGGSVENAACERLVDWAAFFCEYSQAMKPLPEGEAESVPGNNVAYKRWVLERFRRQMEEGAWDFVLHERMRKEHLALYLKPSITVHHKMSASLGWFMSQKFHFARSFSGTRFVGAMPLRRAVYGAGAPLLPFILALRIVSRVWKKGNHRRESLLSFPLLLLLLLSWGAGEAVGYIFGPGSSPARVC